MAFLTLIRKFLPICCVFAVLMLPTVFFAAQSSSNDGDWWQKSSAAAQEGFILGYGDCYADPEGTRVRVVGDEGDVRIAISTYYQSHASERHRPVAKVLEEVWSGRIRMQGSQPARPGEGWYQRHGFLDGGWWKGSNPAEQVSFVEGYMTCHNSLQKREAALRSSATWYTAQVSGWYDQPGDEETVAQRRATKVHDVLSRLQTPSEGGSR